jgi:uncharacterized protein (DUF934 family)
MPKLIDLHGQPMANPWVLLDKEATLEAACSHASGQLIVPLNLWQSSAAELQDGRRRIAIWLDSDEDAATVAPALQDIAFVALNFPAFMDGRSYSKAVILRQQYGYQGEIRAIGDVLRDQLFYMRRCGFSTFDLKDSVKLEEAAKALQDFSTSYTSTVEEPLPLFKRKQSAA